MIRDFHIPPTGFGPGSQPSEAEGEELEYMQMPDDMRTYAPQLPMVEVDEALAPALDLLREIAAAAEQVAGGARPRTFDLLGFDAENRGLIAETMGEGEVAMKLRGIPALSVQESVFIITEARTRDLGTLVIIVIVMITLFFDVHAAYFWKIN